MASYVTSKLTISVHLSSDLLVEGDTDNEEHSFDMEQSKNQCRYPPFSPSYDYHNNYMIRCPSIDYFENGWNHNNTPYGYSRPQSFDGSDEFGTQQLLHKLEQTGRVPSKEKFRRMICQTFVCCGGCPYNERCVFLHDERIELTGFKTRPNKQGKVYGMPKDSFFWPDMPKEKIYQKLDYIGLPSVSQLYDIPEDFAYTSDIHDRAIYSIWNHFVDYCYQTNFLNEPKSNTIRTNMNISMMIDPHYPLKSDDSLCIYNKFIGNLKRLPVFVSLSNGCSLLQQN